MKKPAKLAMVAALTLFPLTAQAAQNPAAAQDQTSAAPKKPASLSGKIGPDGKTFTADKDGCIWHIHNPELLAGIDALHVKVKALVNATLSEIHIVSVSTFAEQHTINYGDAAFRR